MELAGRRQAARRRSRRSVPARERGRPAPSDRPDLRRTADRRPDPGQRRDPAHGRPPARADHRDRRVPRTDGLAGARAAPSCDRRGT